MTYKAIFFFHQSLRLSSFDGLTTVNSICSTSHAHMHLALLVLVIADSHAHAYEVSVLCCLLRPVLLAFTVICKHAWAGCRSGVRTGLWFVRSAADEWSDKYANWCFISLRRALVRGPDTHAHACIRVRGHLVLQTILVSIVLNIVSRNYLLQCNFLSWYHMVNLSLSQIVLVYVKTWFLVFFLSFFNKYSATSAKNNK
jgi:hypothetical protein